MGAATPFKISAQQPHLSFLQLHKPVSCWLILYSGLKLIERAALQIKALYYAELYLQTPAFLFRPIRL